MFYVEVFDNLEFKRKDIIWKFDFSLMNSKHFDSSSDNICFVLYFSDGFQDYELASCYYFPAQKNRKQAFRLNGVDHAFPKGSRLLIKLVDSGGDKAQIIYEYPIEDEQVICTSLKDSDYVERIKSGFTLNKKGRLQERNFSQEKQEALLSLYTEIGRLLGAQFGFRLCITHGTLLGFVREGAFIDGDDDFDCFYLSNNKNVDAVKAERQRISEFLATKGYQVKTGVTGHLKLKSKALELDIMPAWYSGDLFCIGGFTMMRCSLDDIVPFKGSKFLGYTVFTINNPKGFLDHQYGNWEIKDPSFELTVSDDLKELRKKLID